MWLFIPGNETVISLGDKKPMNSDERQPPPPKKKKNLTKLRLF